MQDTEALTEECCCQKDMVQPMKKGRLARTERPLLHPAKISFEAPLSLICVQFRIRCASSLAFMTPVVLRKFLACL